MLVVLNVSLGVFKCFLSTCYSITGFACDNIKCNKNRSNTACAC